MELGLREFDVTWLKDWSLRKLRQLDSAHLGERNRGREGNWGYLRGTPHTPPQGGPCTIRGLLGSHSPGLGPPPSSVGLSGHSSGELGGTPAPSSDSPSIPWFCSSSGLPGSWNQHDPCGLAAAHVSVRASERPGRQPGAPAAPTPGARHQGEDWTFPRE